MNKVEILAKLREHKAEILKKYPVASLALCGSYARGEETADSDVDLLVELLNPMGWDYIDLLEDIEEILAGYKVDLMSKNGIRPERMKYFSEDLIYI